MHFRPCRVILVRFHHAYKQEQWEDCVWTAFVYLCVCVCVCVRERERDPCAEAMLISVFRFFSVCAAKRALDHL